MKKISNKRQMPTVKSTLNVGGVMINTTNVGGVMINIFLESKTLCNQSRMG